MGPKSDEIPPALHGLTTEDVRILRPVSIHQGDMHQAKNGYRRQTQLTKFVWKGESTRSTFDRLSCDEAYRFVMSNKDS